MNNEGIGKGELQARLLDEADRRNQADDSVCYLLTVAANEVDHLLAEIAEIRAERDALLEEPISLAKMDSIDEDATDRMIAYYWWRQATNACAALASPSETPNSTIGQDEEDVGK